MAEIPQLINEIAITKVDGTHPLEAVVHEYTSRYKNLEELWSVAQDVEVENKDYLTIRLVAFLNRLQYGFSTNYFLSIVNSTFPEIQEPGETVVDRFTRAALHHTQVMLATEDEESAGNKRFGLSIFFAKCCLEERMSFDEFVEVIAEEGTEVMEHLLTLGNPILSAEPNLFKFEEPDGDFIQVHINRVTEGSFAQRRILTEEVRQLPETIATLTDHPERAVLGGVSHLVRPRLLRFVPGFSPEDGATFGSYDLTSLIHEFIHSRPKDKNFQQWFTEKFSDEPFPLEKIIRVGFANIYISSTTMRDFLQEGRFPVIGTVLTAPGGAYRRESR